MAKRINGVRALTDEANNCISADDLKTPEILPEVKAQIEAYLQANK